MNSAFLGYEELSSSRSVLSAMLESKGRIGPIQTRSSISDTHTEKKRSLRKIGNLSTREKLGYDVRL